MKLSHNKKLIIIIIMVIIFLILLKIKIRKIIIGIINTRSICSFNARKHTVSYDCKVNKYDFFSIRLGLSKSTIPLFPRFKPIHVPLFSF